MQQATCVNAPLARLACPQGQCLHTACKQCGALSTTQSLTLPAGMCDHQLALPGTTAAHRALQYGLQAGTSLEYMLSLQPKEVAVPSLQVHPAKLPRLCCEYDCAAQ